MSLKAMLEVASVQSNAKLFAQTIAEVLSEENLTVVVEESDETKAVKLTVANATSEETATLIHNVLDMSEASDLKVEVFEGACRTCAYIALTEEQVAGLESASLIEVAERERPFDDDDEEEEEHNPFADSDVSEDDEAEELDKEVEEDDILRILQTEEGFKLVSRLHTMACGNNKQDFHSFLAEMDKVLVNYRNRAGYDGGNETASVTTFEHDVFAALASDDEVVEEARGRKSKGKVKKGRAGFLSAYMKIVGRNADDLAVAWDHLDLRRMKELLSETGGELLIKMDELRVAQGLDKPPKGEEDEVEVETEETESNEETAAVVRN